MKMSNVKKTVISALCLAMCVVLPIAFHTIPQAGSVCSPMHIPVLLCGLICGWQYGMLCGLAGPVLSSLLTNMPPMAYLPPMLVELAVYGTVTGIRLIRCRNSYTALYARLITAMLSGRIAAGITSALFFSRGSYTAGIWLTSYFITSWPAIIIHLIFVPMIIFALEKTKLIPLI